MRRLASLSVGTLVAASALTAALFIAGCASLDPQAMTPTQRRTAIGAGAGAVAGAVVGGSTRSAVIGAGVGALGGYVWSQHMEQNRQAMERATVGTGVAVTQTRDNQLKLDIPSDISFDTGRADIRPTLRPVLDAFARGLQGQPQTEVRIIGHTDNTGSNELNERLSLQRAQATRDYLTARGVAANQIMVAGRGEREPVADNSSEAGRSRNRRVEIFLGERATAAAR
jgi:outer membrane protein OmpA-like peptidoglycan-associated protein